MCELDVCVDFVSAVSVRQTQSFTKCSTKPDECSAGGRIACFVSDTEVVQRVFREWSFSGDVRQKIALRQLQRVAVRSGNGFGFSSGQLVFFE